MATQILPMSCCKLEEFIGLHLFDSRTNVTFCLERASSYQGNPWVGYTPLVVYPPFDRANRETLPPFRLAPHEPRLEKDEKSRQRNKALSPNLNRILRRLSPFAAKRPFARSAVTLAWRHTKRRIGHPASRPHQQFWWTKTNVFRTVWICHH